MKFPAVLLIPMLLVAADPGRVGEAAGRRPAPVALILMENHKYGQIVGNPDARYLNRRFIPAGKLFTHYWAITHPSLPNYLALTSGKFGGCTGDRCRTNIATDNVFHQLSRASLSWRTFAQSMPSPCYRKNSGRYVYHHNPAVYYTNIYPQPCRTHVLAYPSTLPDPLPRFTFIVPNLCADMHDCSVAAGDRWLRDHVPALLHAGAIVVITFDEGAAGSNHVMTAMVGPGVLAGARSQPTYDHYGLLAGIETHFGLPLLHRAKDARILHL